MNADPMAVATVNSDTNELFLPLELWKFDYRQGSNSASLMSSRNSNVRIWLCERRKRVKMLYGTGHND